MNWRSELEAIIEAVPPDQAPDAIGELEAAKARLYARLTTPSTDGGPHKRGGVPAEPDRLLKVKEAATILAVKEPWLYRHADTLPFTRRLGRKCLRFSEAGLRRWMATRR